MDYSLIICTYNPDLRLLLRCFNAVKALQTAPLQTEVIVVDNNSQHPPSSLLQFESFVKDPSWSFSTATTQGVQFARIKGITQASGRYIVYIDADNEPAPDYLLQLQQLNGQYPEVGAWGPGRVNVDFVDGVPAHLEQYASIAFQQRNETGTRFVRNEEWQDCYPFGTGLCMRSEVLKDYVARAANGQFTLEGRSGGKLSSGEDTQMVLLCIQHGYAAGVSAALQLTHMIPGERTQPGYLRRLAYGTSRCYATCLLQVFPGKKNLLEQWCLPPGKMSKQIFQRWWQWRKKKDDIASFALAFFIGNASAPYIALGKPIPAVVTWVVRKLQLE